MTYGHFTAGPVPKPLSPISRHVPLGTLLRAGDDNVCVVYVKWPDGLTILGPGEDVLIEDTDPRDITLTSDVNTDVAFFYQEKPCTPNAI